MRTRRPAQFTNLLGRRSHPARLRLTHEAMGTDARFKTCRGYEMKHWGHMIDIHLKDAIWIRWSFTCGAESRSQSSSPETPVEDSNRSFLRRKYCGVVGSLWGRYRESLEIQRTFAALRSSARLFIGLAVETLAPHGEKITWAKNLSDRARFASSLL